MRIRTTKKDIDIPSWLVLFTVLAIDSMYANHCKKSTIKKLLKESDPE